MLGLLFGFLALPGRAAPRRVFALSDCLFNVSIICLLALLLANVSIACWLCRQSKPGSRNPPTEKQGTETRQPNPHMHDGDGDGDDAGDDDDKDDK